MKQPGDYLDEFWSLDAAKNGWTGWRSSAWTYRAVVG